MQITKEMLLQKKQELEARREEALGCSNACNGALEDIEFWLYILEQPSAEDLAEDARSDFEETTGLRLVKK